MEFTKIVLVLTLGQCFATMASAQCSSNKYGPECRYDCHCAPWVTCNSDTGCTTTTTCADGWDGGTCQRQNVARGCTTWQSSTLHVFISAYAVDGVVGNFYSATPCTHTHLSRPAIWNVTLNQTYDIYRFRINNRVDHERLGWRLNGFTVSVRQTSGEYSLCYNDTTTTLSGPGDIIDRTCQDGSPIRGNQVQIQIQYQDLSLCEVLLYVCADGTYGEYCDNYCGECRDNNPCDKETGICPWTDPTRCKDRLSGEKCDQCIHGRWGQTCQSRCGQCLKDETCDRQTGNCPLVNLSRCEDGFMEPQCQECISGRWGETCQSECGQCLNDNRCDRQTGDCPLVGTIRCKLGFVEPQCQECVTGRWGEHCEFHCGNCLNDKCVKETGRCPLEEGCKSGYNGTKCTSVCDVGTWGPNCYTSCGKCFNGAVCNKTSGSCPSTEGNPICLPGYEAPLCSDPCRNRTWGSNCQRKCGNCYANGPCGPSEGVCPNNSPRCAPGYFGNLCNSSCVPGKHGSDCVGFCGSCADGPTACNGETGACPLKQGQSACAERFTGQDCKTEISSHVGVIVGAIVGALVIVACVVVAVIFFRRRRNGSAEKEGTTVQTRNSERAPQAGVRYVADENDVAVDVNADDTGNTYENGAPSPVPSDEFAQFVENKKSVDGFKSEFEKFPVGLCFEHKAADLPHNKLKSRYKSLMAYDHSRVLLEGGPENDYINACYIDGYNDPKKFIASQGATALIIKDFVRMIWEQKVGKVVMVTNLVEGTKTKCVQYWPNQGTRTIGVIGVTLLAEDVYADFTTRTLRLTHSENNRSMEVKQFHFTTWPDHGVPSHATALLDFREKVLVHETNANGPILVHCSAGIGRTGTFIALDYLINQANNEGVLDVQDCVRQLRKQRVNMVQTQEQYEFLHEALVEALKLNQGSIAAVHFYDAYIDLCALNPATGGTKMAEQFQVLKEFTPILDKSKVGAALKPENSSKNRSNKILAADSCRPFLSTPVTGYNDYINAVFIPGFRIKRGFILTQTPLPNTVVDFWRLVYEQDICTIVMLDQPDIRDKSVGFHLPEKEGKFDGFEVVETDVEDRQDFAVRAFQLTYKDMQVEKPIKHISCKFWSETPSEESIPSLLNVIQFVEDRQKQAGSQPVLVYCRDGTTKSGFYCAASSVIERVKIDQDVNIVQTLKQMRTCRPSIIPNLDQFNLLHQIVLKYLESFNTYVNFTSSL